MEHLLTKPFIDLALILTKKDFGDGHLLINVITKEHGVIKASAFGGQRISKRYAGGLEYFRTSIMEFTPKRSVGELKINLSAIKSTEKIYSNVSKDINKYITASYIQEFSSMLLNQLEPHGKSEHAFFDMINDTLDKINNANKDDVILLLDKAYHLCIFMLHDTGFLPELCSTKDESAQLKQLEQFHHSVLENIPKSFTMLSDMINNTCQIKGSSGRSQ